MNVEKIRNEMTEKKGQLLKFKVNGARNQIEEFEGRIVDTYPAVFTVETNNVDNRIKSFTYSDILIENLEIKE